MDDKLSCVCREQQAHNETQEKHHQYAARLHSVRRVKDSLEGELLAARTAHARDLAHFEEMEQAVGVVVGEYATLATERAKNKVMWHTQLNHQLSASIVWPTLVDQLLATRAGCTTRRAAKPRAEASSRDQP